MLWDALLLALREIRRNLMRSSLTSLGIIIGVAAVIIMVTLGGGATAQVTSQISGLGSNLIQVMPGQRHAGPGGTQSSAPAFIADDVEAIRLDISGINPPAPVSTQRTQAIYGSENWPTSVVGSTNAYIDIREWELEYGRRFTSGELRSGKAVCILGNSVRKELFGSLDPLGSTIRLKKLSCRVIGVIRAKGQSTFGIDQDDFVLMPLRTIQRRIAGNSDVDLIYISAIDGFSTEKVKGDIERLLRERRHIKGDDDFNVMDMKEIIDVLSGTLRILTTLLGAVAAISLLVGGIGIMNIMLVSVTERTREIGIRLAIGALEREVLMQFLVEAVVLSSFGGLIGIVLAVVISAWLANILLIPFILNLGIILVAFIFSVAVGIIFGYFPALRAAHLDPIDALRHE